MANLTFRPATMDDARLLYDWRSHPSTRAMMFDSDPFTFEQHTEWLSGVLANKRSLLWVAEVDDESGGTMPVGTVRLDIVPNAAAEVSVTTAPDKRGRGYGTLILRNLYGIALNMLMLDRLVARIKPDNAASLKAFANAGFVEESRDDKEVVMVAKRRN